MALAPMLHCPAKIMLQIINQAKQEFANLIIFDFWHD